MTIVERIEQDEEVEHVYAGEMFELHDGRRMVALQVVLKPAEPPETLGIHVGDGVGVGDHFGGA